MPLIKSSHRDVPCGSIRPRASARALVLLLNCSTVHLSRGIAAPRPPTPVYQFPPSCLRFFVFFNRSLRPPCLCGEHVSPVPRLPSAVCGPQPAPRPSYTFAPLVVQFNRSLRPPRLCVRPVCGAAAPCLLTPVFCLLKLSPSIPRLLPSSGTPEEGRPAPRRPARSV